MLHHIVIPDAREQAQVLHHELVGLLVYSEVVVGETREGDEAGGDSSSRGQPWRGVLLHCGLMAVLMNAA